MSEQKQEPVDFVLEAGKYKTLLTTKYNNRKPFEPVNPNEVHSIIPGTVIKLYVKEGDSIEKNTPLLILEAMKMENIIRMPFSGTVKKIHVSEGIRISKNSLMLELEEK